jgi:hypothetical protein
MHRKPSRRPWGVWLLLALGAASAVWMTLHGNRTANGIWNLAGFAVLLAAILLSRLLLGRSGGEIETEAAPEKTPEPEDAAPAQAPEPELPPEEKLLPPEPPEATPFTRKMRELVLISSAQTHYYQLILGQRQLHLIDLGDEMTPEGDRWFHMLPTTWDDERISTAKRTAWSIDYGQLHELTVDPICPGARETDACGTLKLRSRSFSGTFSMRAQPSDPTPAELREFFRPAGGVVRIDTRRYDGDRAALSQIRADKRGRAAVQDKALLQKLRFLEYLLPVLTVPCLLLSLTHAVLLPTLLFLAPYALLILLPEYFSVGKLLSSGPVIRSPIPNTVDLSYAVLVTGAPSALNLLRFHVENPALPIALSAILAVAGTVLITRHLPKLQMLWFARVALLIILLFSAAGMLLGVNSLFDWRAPEPTAMRVMDKYYDSSPTLVLRDPDGAEITRTVDSDLYWDARPGGHAVLVRRVGALGIVCTEVWSGEDWASQNPGSDPWAID